MSENNVEWKKRHPSTTIKVKQVELQKIGDDDWCWLKNTHKKIIIIDEKEGEITAAIINGLSELIKPNCKYTIWFDYTDLHDRYVEILCIEKK